MKLSPLPPPLLWELDQRTFWIKVLRTILNSLWKFRTNSKSFSIPNSGLIMQKSANSLFFHIFMQFLGSRKNLMVFDYDHFKENLTLYNLCSVHFCSKQKGSVTKRGLFWFFEAVYLPHGHLTSGFLVFFDRNSGGTLVTLGYLYSPDFSKSFDV